jgi:hypothetical protein
LPSYVEVSAAISLGSGVVRADVRARPSKRVKVERGEGDRPQSGPSSASQDARRNCGEDEESDADDESDYEQLEAPEHSSEGNQTSDWEGDASDCNSYAEHAREVEALALRRQEAQSPNRVSDSLLHFLRASPNRGPSCCGCGQVESSSPSFNPPPDISLLQAYHPLQPGYYSHHPSQPLYYPSHPPMMGHQLSAIFAPIHFTAAPPSGIKSLLPAQRYQPGRPVGH